MFLFSRCGVRAKAKLTLAQARYWCDAAANYRQTHDSAHSTVDPEEVKHFSNLSQNWWNSANGEFATLHALNDLRVPLVRDALIGQRNYADVRRSASKPLAGCKVLDAGCGGGILCEPLARLGSTVVGVDASKESIDVAIRHRDQQGFTSDNLQYIHGAVEELLERDGASFDAVVSSEVIEHVSDMPHFVSACVGLVKAGGSVIFTTINRTQAAYWLAIVMAESLLKVLPRGTHDWDKFVTPDELQFELSKNACHTRLAHGMLYNPLTLRWSWTHVREVNYALHAIKNTVTDT